jgi:hypothetical protein
VLSGLIVREVKESILGSRLGPALTVRFVRVHEGSLEARYPAAPRRTPASAPLRTPPHPTCTPLVPQVGADPRGGGARSLQLRLVSAIEIDAPQAGHSPPNLAPCLTPTPTRLQTRPRPRPRLQTRP